MMMDFLLSNSSGLTSVPENGSCLFLRKWCPDMPQAIYAYWAAGIFTVTVGTPSCALVLWIPMTGKRFQSLSQVAAYNCVASDALYCVALCLELANVFLGMDMLTRVAYFFHGFNLLGRPLFLFSVCVDRYLAVTQAHLYRRLKKDQTVRWASMALIWASCLAFCLTLSLTSFSGMPLAAGSLILALLITMVFLSALLLRALRAPAPGADTVHPVKRAALLTAASTLARLLLFYLPIVAVSLAFSITGTDYCSDFGFMSCVLVPASFAMTTLASGFGSLYILFKAKKLSCCCRQPAEQESPH